MKLGLQCYGLDKNRARSHPTSRHLISRHLTNTFPVRQRREIASVTLAFSPVSLLVYWDGHRGFPIFRCPPITPGYLTHTSKPNDSISVQGFEHISSDFITSRDGFRKRGALGYLSFWAPRNCDLFGRLCEKRAWKYAPLVCSTPSKSIFCGADFGSTIALDIQQKLKPFLHSSKEQMA